MPQTVSKNSPSTNVLPSTSRPSATKKAVTTSRSATVMPTWSKRRTCGIGPSSRRRIDRTSATVGVLSTSRCGTSANAHYQRHVKWRCYSRSRSATRRAAGPASLRPGYPASPQPNTQDPISPTRFGAAKGSGVAPAGGGQPVGQPEFLGARLAVLTANLPARRIYKAMGDVQHKGFPYAALLGCPLIGEQPAITRHDVFADLDRCPGYIGGRPEQVEDRLRVREPEESSFFGVGMRVATSSA